MCAPDIQDDRRLQGDPASGSELRARVEAALLHGGAAAVGVCSVAVLGRARSVLEARRSAGLHDGMQFTFRNPARSSDPRSGFPSARSAVVVALPYDTHRPPRPGGLSAEVARYAAEDTYASLREVLAAGVQEIRAAGHRGVVVADDNALVDRSIALRAGLGWLGKNSNLLVPGVGSWVVIGTILTDAALPAGVAFSQQATTHTGAAREIEAGCGTCTRCARACPTAAIVAPGVLDASRCLSWLLQRRGDFPRSHRVALGARIYGCDDCQSACPPSSGATTRARPGDAATETPLAGPGSAGHWVDIAEMLELDDEALLGRFASWYTPDRDPRWLRRNALVVLGNLVAQRAGPGASAGQRLDVERARQLLRRYLRDEDPILVRHAAWAARRAGLAELLAEEPCAAHPEVRAELARPHPHRDNGADG